MPTARSHIGRPASSGDARFSYQVCDNGAPILCAVAPVMVTIEEAPSVNQTYAFPDIVYGRTNRQVEGNVLLNDLDPEGDIQTVSSESFTPPAYGTLNVEEDGTFVYTPFADYAGEDRFAYRVCDNGTPQACADAEVRLQIFPPNLGWDFGDAGGYNTHLAAGKGDGPRHALVDGLALGKPADAEADAISNRDADGDDTTGVNDEEVIGRYPVYDNGDEYRLEVPVVNQTPYAAQLVGWIDWDADSRFENAGERSLAAVHFDAASAAALDDSFTTANIPAGYSGIVTLTWRDFQVPTGPSSTKYVRLRLAAELPGSEPFFSGEGPQPDGSATGGTVIDTLAAIATEPVDIASIKAERLGSAINFKWTTLFESGVSGYFILRETPDGFERINTQIVPARGTGTASAIHYTLQAKTPATAFYLEIELDGGETYLRGPFYTAGEYLQFLPHVAVGGLQVQVQN